MARSHPRSSPKMSLSRPVARVRVHSPSLRRKSGSNICFENDQEVEFLSGEAENFINNEGAGAEFEGGNNKVMVVVDSSLEAKGALEWALSHTIQGQDTIVLLHVAKPRKRESTRKRNPRVYEMLQSMKNMCQMKRPGVQVEVAKVEGKEKGPIIVEAAKQYKVSLLVLGQRKKSMIWRIMRRWAVRKRSGRGGGVVDYCIQNASCMTIAVRRKSNELGGYLITTKRHKNFWLLA
ncbi:UspA [Corchorus capsularis]|uniref:UspA n=1 Tax=Corchorus capsularis TaxID=210143 RepID=A0A1R3FUM5_COCAP|nr:UspA [Corchorus capsularis]